MCEAPCTISFNLHNAITIIRILQMRKKRLSELNLPNFTQLGNGRAGTQNASPPDRKVCVLDHQVKLQEKNGAMDFQKRFH